MKALICILLVSLSLNLWAQQRPFINSIDRLSATVGETITLTGSGFSANPADLKVFFGAGEGTVTSSSTTQIKVTVPGNATYDPITVINTTNNLSGASSELFTLSYDGESIQSSGFDAINEIATGFTFSYDLCMCDFNSDGLLDFGVTHEDDQTVVFFQNTSTVDAPSFTKLNLLTYSSPFTTLGIDCDDLNQDGKPDLVIATGVGTNAIHAYFYENTSNANISFTERSNITLPVANPLRDPRKVKISDIDGDGRKDIVIGNQRDNNLYIYKNSGSGSTFSINSTPTAILVPGLTDAGAFDVKDMNGDNLPDISIISYDDSNMPIAVLQNTSSPGDIKFDISLINSLGTRQNTYIGDLNNDGFAEIATVSSSSNRVSVFQNTTSQRGQSITFSATPINTTVTSPLSLTMGDMNGDGLVDIIIGGANVQVLTNEFDGSNMLFNPVSMSTSLVSRNIKVGDINGDARPDLAFVYNSTLGAAGSFATLLNRNCYSPVIEPTDLTFCPNSTFTLYATKTLAATYTWSISSGTGTIMPNGSGDNADVTITAGTTATIQVEIVPTNNGSGDCTNTSQQVFNLTGTTPPTAPSITASVPNSVCTGEANYTLSAPSGLDNYFWTLPDGSEGTNSETLTFTTLTAENAGVYTLRTQDGTGCVSNEATYEVIVNEPPIVTINNQGSDNFCDGSTIILEVPNYPGLSFSWQESGVDITGETASTLDVTASGAYTATISDGTCDNVSPIYNVTAVPAPVSSFATSFMESSTSNTICIDVPLDFTATSTGSGSFALSYDWDFGDSNTATGATTPHTYTSTAGSPYTATLTTSYSDIAGCSDQNTIQITVADQVAGDIPITAVGGSTEKCPSDSILLELPQNYVSYLWSTGEDTFSEYAKTRSGETDVTLTVDVVTDIGCTVTAQQTISNFANSGIGLTADQTITNDTIDLPEGIQMVSLTASNSTDGYEWTINGSVNSTTGDVLTVQPTQRVTIVTVEGTDPNGCEEMSQVTILLPAVIPRKTFSPNEDGLGFDCWEILNTSALEGCKVYIFDNRGRHLLVTDSPFENNCVWDGMAEGQPAPEGIYYFVMKCDDESINQTGSITLAR